MTKQKDINSVGEASAEAVVDADGNYVGINETAEELLGYSEAEVIGESIGLYSANLTLEHGRNFQRVVNGDEINMVAPLETKDGEKLRCRVHGKPLVGDAIKLTFEPIENSPSTDEESFKAITDDERLSEIAENIRIETPGGTMTLAEMMYDITVGQKEVEQYRKGALGFCSALENRLAEEKSRNPNSDEVAAIREVKKSADELYESLLYGAKDN
jgi:PAS domain S-box-containing protein